MTSLLLSERFGYEKESYYSNLSFLFGNLPILLPIKQIIIAASNSKTFKIIQHTENNFKGEIIKSKFFKLKPTNTFIELHVGNEETIANDSMKDYDSVSVEALFEKNDASSVELEFQRIIKLLTPDFDKGKIERETTKTTFYKSAYDTIPTLVIFINTVETKYIKLIHYKK